MSKVTLKLLALFGFCAFVIWSDCGCPPPPTPADPDGDTPSSYSVSRPRLNLDTAFVPWSDAAGEVMLVNTSPNGANGHLDFSGFEGNCPAEIEWSPTTFDMPHNVPRGVEVVFKPSSLTPASGCHLTPRITSGGVRVAGYSLMVEYEAGEAKCELSPGQDLGSGHEVIVDPVTAGATVDFAITITNFTSDPSKEAPFRYEFRDPSPQCAPFSWAAEGDRAGGVQSGGQRAIPLSFSPPSPGTFTCRWDLVTKTPDPIPEGYPGLPTQCPTSVVFKGTGLPTTPQPVCALEPVTDPVAEFPFGGVNVGDGADMTLTILNKTPDVGETNRFRFLFDNPSGDCDLFTIDPDNGEIGPDGTKNITVTFTPDNPGTFQCTRNLSSLEVGTDQSIASPCPAQVTWTGTGAVSALEWSTCQPTGTTNWQGIFGFSGSEVFITGESGSVFQSAGDCQWESVGTMPGDVQGVTLTDLWGYSDGTETVVYAVGNIPPEPGFFSETGAVVKWEGSDWAIVDKDGLHTYTSVWGSSPDNVYFGGAGVATDFPNAKHWDGNALVPFQISDMGMSNVRGLSGIGSNDIWAVLDQGFKSVFRFNGSQWEDKTPSFITEPLYDVGVYITTLEAEVIAVGENGAIYHYDGADWVDVSISGETRDFHAVWVGPGGRIVVVGEDRAVYLGNVSDPTGWTLMPAPLGDPSDDFLDVWGPSDDVIYVTGTGGGVYRLTPSG